DDPADLGRPALEDDQILADLTRQGQIATREHRHRPSDVARERQPARDGEVAVVLADGRGRERWLRGTWWPRGRAQLRAAGHEKSHGDPRERALGLHPVDLPSRLDARGRGILPWTALRLSAESIRGR